jgi:hypothetical protein
MGCVEQRDGRKWIGTLHPAHVMRFSATSVYEECLGHLRKARVIAGTRVPTVTIHERPGPGDIARHRDAARLHGIFADDVEAYQPEETTDEDDFADPEWRMDICGFSAIPYEAIILDRDELAAAWGDIWADTEILQCEHNGESDRFHLAQVAPQRERSLPEPQRRFDTMLAHHFLHNNIHKYLKPECLRLYTNLPYYNRDIEGQVGRRFYCGMDNIAELLIAMEQIRLMKADIYPDTRNLEGSPEGLPTGRVGRLFAMYFGLAFPGEPGLGRMLPILEEQRRLGINTDLRTALLFKVFLEDRIEKQTQAITDLIGPGFNWRSYAPGGDVQTLFYEKWGLPKQFIKDPKTHQTKVTCNDAARKDLAEWIEARPERQEKYAEAAHYFTLNNELASTTKLLEYIQRISPDKRIHALQKAHGTVNFRVASKPNTQNFPDWPILRRCETCGATQPGGKLLQSAECCGQEMGPGLPSMRAMVVPDNPEDLLLAADLDQAELWPYAVNFDIKYLLDIYASGTYIYGAVYEDMVGKQFFKPGMPRIKKNMTDAMSYGSLREAKAIPLGFLYGMEGDKLSQRQGWVGQCRCDHEIEWHNGKCLHADCDCSAFEEKGNYYRREWERLNPELYMAHGSIRYEMEQRAKLRPPPGWLFHVPQKDGAGINCFGSSPAQYHLWTTTILIDHALKQRRLTNSRIIMTMHDSVLLNIGNAAVDPAPMRVAWEEIVKPIITRPLLWLKNFQYRCSASVGPQWDWEMVDVDKWLSNRQR